ncbi:MAG: 30S ribosomal protein S16 [Candidatus Firestonebacteria bacterium]|nr:30S ribosomal protein S16 [Candidatus Firestonebacteria bacterium]
MGPKKRPFYRIVVADIYAPRDGKFIETLGNYNPLTDPASVNVNEEKILVWLGKGAKPTDTVRKLLSSCGIMAKFVENKKKINA